MPPNKKRMRECTETDPSLVPESKRVRLTRPPLAHLKGKVDETDDQSKFSPNLCRLRHQDNSQKPSRRGSVRYSNSTTPVCSTQTNDLINTVKGTTQGDGGGGDDNDVDDYDDDDDDEGDGHLVYSVGDILQNRYKIVSTLGEGTFGKVVHCCDLKRNDEMVALKIVKKIKRYRVAATLEISVLDQILRFDPNRESLCIRMLDWFDYCGHICISFDLLGLSVFDFLRDNCFQPYTMEHVRHISYQLCKAVKFLHTHGLTHTDLKPENILFCNSAFDVLYDSEKKMDYRKLRCCDIRLIDFGSATFEHEHHSTVVSTRHYRAPEVVLELGWSFPCDVWSIGCIMFEMYSGSTLFQTHDSLEHLAIMEKVLGKIPQAMIKNSRKVKYFKRGRLNWKEKTPDEQFVVKNCKPLKKYMRCAEDDDHLLFDLIGQMLVYSTDKRMTLVAAVDHEYFELANH